MSGAQDPKTLAPHERQLLINQALWVLIYQSGGEIAIPLEDINYALSTLKMGSIHLSAEGNNIHFRCLDIDTHNAILEKYSKGLSS